MLSTDSFRLTKWESRKPSEKSRHIKFHEKFSFLILKGTYVMKRARIMLSSIAVIAIVSGAVAFKAHTSPVTFYEIDPGGTQHFCTLAFQTNETTVNGIDQVNYSDQPVDATVCTTLVTSNE